MTFIISCFCWSRHSSCCCCLGVGLPGIISLARYSGIPPACVSRLVVQRECCSSLSLLGACMLSNWCACSHTMCLRSSPMRARALTSRMWKQWSASDLSKQGQPSGFVNWYIWCGINTHQSGGSFWKSPSYKSLSYPRYGCHGGGTRGLLVGEMGQ